MSLSHIRTLRRAGQKPAMVTVLIGRAPQWLDDGPLLVRVGESSRPAAMDWTPLMGVWVTVHWIGGSADLARAVVDSLEGVGAKLFGASGASFAVSLTASPNESEERVVRQERELLCTR